MLTNHTPWRSADIPLPVGRRTNVCEGQAVSRQDSRSSPGRSCVSIRSVVSKIFEHRLCDFLYNRMSISCLIRKSSNIAIRNCDVRPLILRVATL
jgi:hypothetical protein